MGLGTDYIVRYLSDISGAVQGAKQLESINTTMAKNIQKQYGQVTKIIGNLPEKVQTVPIVFKGEDAIKTMRTLGEVIQTTNGSFLQMGKTQTFINGEFIKSSTSVKDVTAQFRVGNIETEKAAKSLLSLTGQASKLSTNFTNVSDVNAKFSNELKKFGDATGVIDSGLVKVAGNTSKLEAVVQTADGKFLKLNETITNTPDGMQKISRSALDVSDKYLKLGKVQENVAITSSQLGTNFKNLSDINAKFSKELSGVGNITRIVGQNINEVSGNTARIGIVGQTTSGQFVQLKESLTKSSDGVQKVTRSMSDMTGQFVKGNVEAAKGNKIFTNFSDNVKQLAGRALLTIPIWIALRGGIMGVFSAIQGGFRDLIAFDLALQKIRNNLQGTPQQVASDFKKMKNSITEASKATGVSTEEIAGAVKQFATLGFSASESLQGGLAATKLSIALFGDASNTAEAFAKALNILIDRSDGAKSSVDQMNEAFALTSQLEETNNFEIKNVTEALNKFGGTAAGVGLTMNQTLQILAALGTAGRSGSEGATLLSTAFNTLLKNLPNLSSKLGLVTIAGESTFNTFRRIIDKIVELNNIPGGKQTAITAMSDIFGGARGIKIVQSLVAVKDILDANIKTLPNFEALNSKVARTLENESGQAKILGNSLKETGKSFVTAIMGGEDFTQSLIKLNKIVGGLSASLRPLGATINALFSNLGFIAGAAFLFNWSKVVTVSALLKGLLFGNAQFEQIGLQLAFLFSRGLNTGLKAVGKIALLSIGEAFSGATLGTLLGASFKALISPITITWTLLGKLAMDAFTESFIQNKRTANEKIQTANDQIVAGLKGGLAISDLKILIKKITAESKPGENERMIAALQLNLKKQIESGEIKAKVPVNLEPILGPGQQEELAKAVIAFKINELKLQGATNTELAIAERLLTNQLNISEDALTIAKKKIELEQISNEEAVALNNIQKEGLISNQLEMLKLQGASNLQIVEHRIEFEKIYGLRQQNQDLLKNDIELARARNEEEMALDNIQRTKLIENQLEILRIQGATTVQLIEQRIRLEEMYGINQKEEDFLNNKLELEQEITKEKINQNKVSSDELKIFQIAQKYGIQKATTVANFLTGKIPLSTFESGGRESDLMPILKEFFASELEQFQAQKFFFEGLGKQIPIPSREANNEFRPQQLPPIPVPPLPLPPKVETSLIPSIQTLQLKTDIGQINISLQKMFSAKDSAKDILDVITAAIRNDPEFKKLFQAEVIEPM